MHEARLVCLWSLGLGLVRGFFLLLLFSFFGFFL